MRRSRLTRRCHCRSEAESVLGESVRGCGVHPALSLLVRVMAEAATSRSIDEVAQQLADVAAKGGTLNVALPV